MTPPVGAASAANLACTLKGHRDIEAAAVIAAVPGDTPADKADPAQDFRLFMSARDTGPAVPGGDIKHPGQSHA